MLALAYFLLMLFFGGLLIATFVFGEVAEVAGNAVEAAGNAIEGALESLPVGQVELTGDVQIGHGGCVGITRSLMAFLTFFGGCGFIAVVQLNATRGESLVAGLTGGLVAGVTTYLFYRMIASHETTAAIPLAGYVGRTGIVTIGITPTSSGAIQVIGPGGIDVFSARADTNIPAGTTVTIKSMEGGVAHVEDLEHS